MPCEARQSGDVIISEKVNESRILTGERDNVLQLLSQTGLHLCRFDMLGDHYVAHVQKDQFFIPCSGFKQKFVHSGPVLIRRMLHLSQYSRHLGAGRVNELRGAFANS